MGRPYGPLPVGRLRAAVGRLAFGDPRVDLGAQRGHDLVLADLLDHLAAAVDEAGALARGDGDVGLGGLAGPVHDAAHDRDAARVRQALRRLLDLLREPDQVDLGATARRARVDVEDGLAQAHRLEQGVPDADLLPVVARDRDADRVADALREQDAERGRRLENRGLGRAGVRDAQVDRVVAGGGELSIGLDRERHRVRLDRDQRVVEAERLEDLDVVERLAHAQVDHLVVGGLDLERLPLADRARVDADAHRDAAVLGGADDLLDFLARADVARVDAHLVDALRDRLEGERRREVDVGDERDLDPALDLAERLRLAHRRYRGAHEFAARGLEADDLVERRFDVAGVALRHRLDADGVSAAENEIPDAHRARAPPGREELPRARGLVEGAARPDHAHAAVLAGRVAHAGELSAADAASARWTTL